MKILYLGDPARYARYSAAAPYLAQQPCVALSDQCSDEEVLQACPDAQAILCDPMRSLSASLIDALPQLRLIHSEGVAFHRFDADAARARHIYLCNCKGCNASAVAEQTILLMLGLLRQVLPSHAAVCAGKQAAVKTQHMLCGDLRELSACSVGLVGFGDIARATAKLLQAFGATVFYYNRTRRSPAEEAMYGVSYLPLTELASRCDIISLHLAVAPETTGIVNAAFLKRMQPGALLINTARGELIDNQAVLDALYSGTLGGIGLDTIAPEPVPADHPFLSLPEEIQKRVLYSPHIGGNTGDSFRRAFQLFSEHLQAVAAGQTPSDWVNPW